MHDFNVRPGFSAPSDLRALLPGAVPSPSQGLVALAQSFLVFLTIQMGNLEGRIPISLYWGSKNVSTLKSQGQGEVTYLAFYPGQVAHLNMIMEDLEFRYNNHPAPPECIIQKDI